MVEIAASPNTSLQDELGRSSEKNDLVEGINIRLLAETILTESGVNKQTCELVELISSRNQTWGWLGLLSNKNNETAGAIMKQVDLLITELRTSGITVPPLSGRTDLKGRLPSPREGASTTGRRLAAGSPAKVDGARIKRGRQ